MFKRQCGISGTHVRESLLSARKKSRTHLRRVENEAHYVNVLYSPSVSLKLSLPLSSHPTVLLALMRANVTSYNDATNSEMSLTGLRSLRDLSEVPQLPPQLQVRPSPAANPVPVPENNAIFILG